VFLFLCSLRFAIIFIDVKQISLLIMDITSKFYEILELNHVKTE